MKVLGQSLKNVAAAAMVGAAILAGSNVKADVIAFNASGTPTQVAGQGLVGFEFTLTQNVYVTKVGFFALFLGGGDTPHVTLSNVTGGLVNPPAVIYDTGTLAPGTLTNNAWNYVSVSTPILLTTGNTYELSAPLYWTNQYAASSGFSFGSAIATPTFLKGGGWNGWPNGGYNFATQSVVTSKIDVSANFQYQAAASSSPVPEPASIGLLGAGAMALLSRRRKA